jgi:hypothetical protein
VSFPSSNRRPSPREWSLGWKEELSGLETGDVLTCQKRGASLFETRVGTKDVKHGWKNEDVYRGISSDINEQEIS